MDKLVPVEFAARCRPAVKAYLNRAEMALLKVGKEFPEHYRPMLEADAKSAFALLEEIDMILTAPAPEPAEQPVTDNPATGRVSAAPALLTEAEIDDIWEEAILALPMEFHAKADAAFAQAKLAIRLVDAEPVATVMAEVSKAVAKFPTWPTDPLHALAVLGEEYGELNKAVLQTVYEPHKVTHEELHTEAVQTAAMSIRFLQSLLDGRYVFAKSEQHAQPLIPAPTKGKS